MASFKGLLLAYLVGGFTFIPLVIILSILYIRSDFKISFGGDRNQSRSGTVRDASTEELLDGVSLKDLYQGSDEVDEDGQLFGKFVISRQYNPAVLTTKQRSKSSRGSNSIDSDSTFAAAKQTIGDPTLTPDRKHTANTGRAAINNSFYIVLRNYNLDFQEQFEQCKPKLSIDLNLYDVDVFADGELLKDGELWNKAAAIRLRKRTTRQVVPDLFIFGESATQKEDLYLSILSAQQNSIPGDERTCVDLDAAHTMLLIRKLHSSQANMQAAWLNALFGRLFLALYRTPAMELAMREKLNKKIAKLKKVQFIKDIALQSIDLGSGVPFILNPRLRDLGMNGECIIEADIDYDSNLRVEFAATARINLGPHLKAQEFSILLAATCRKIAGHVLIRIKPPPSNRIWFTFEKMPTVDILVEPVIGNWQIKQGLILKAIESRILEVIGETVVFPNWDDTPFFNTENESVRGGIWNLVMEKPHVRAGSQTSLKQSAKPSAMKIEVSKETQKSDRGPLSPTVANWRNAASALTGRPFPVTKKSQPSLKSVRISESTDDDRSIAVEDGRSIRSNSDTSTHAHPESIMSFDDIAADSFTAHLQYITDHSTTTPQSMPALALSEEPSEISMPSLTRRNSAGSLAPTTHSSNKSSMSALSVSDLWHSQAVGETADDIHIRDDFAGFTSIDGVSKEKSTTASLNATMAAHKWAWHALSHSKKRPTPNPTNNH